MKIYKLTSPNTDLVYVGKTIQTLHRRFQKHRNSWTNPNADYCSSQIMLEFGEVSIEMIEETENKDREGFWINELNSCNKVKFKYDNKETDKLYRENNKERINGEIICELCGASTSRNNIRRHQKSRNCKSVIKN
jgi:hypothetical protein